MGPEQVAQAVALNNDGRSVRYIANTLGIPRSTVSDALQKFRETGVYTRRPGQGRRRATNHIQDRFLRMQALRDRTVTASALVQRLNDVHNNRVSVYTVRRRLNEGGLRSRRPATGPLLTVEHRRQRLEFAREHADWGLEDWSAVLFTDESRFTLYKSDGRDRVWRRTGERFAEACLSTKVPFGGGGVMMWAGISLTANTELVRIRDGTITADRYIQQCLEEHVMPFAPFLGENFRLMQDNARPHIARITRAYLQEVGITLLQWPARSPDLNPMEHAWDMLGRRIRRNHEEFPTLDRLAEALTAEWNQIHQEDFAVLIRSMPDRMAAVIRARGGHTSY